MNNMKKYFLITAMVVSGIISASASADTIGNYMTVVNNIPKTAMQPTDDAQAWVRSARSILLSTNETMAQTVVSVNRIAAKQGHPIFCFPPGTPFDASTVDDLIQKTYTHLQQTQGEVAPATPVSDVLMMGMLSEYACSAAPMETTGVEGGGMSQSVTPMESVQALPQQPIQSASNMTNSADSAPAL